MPLPALSDRLPPGADRVRFVLVEPSHPGNIGAAARAIKTMGFSDLRLVRPGRPDCRESPEAIALSTSSVDVLRAARVHDSLLDALSGVSLAVALSGYSREYGPPLRALRDCAGEATARLLSAPDARLAFVFGTERRGLSNADLSRCQLVAAIPANPDSPSLNLAQSVQVAAYEAQLALLAGAGREGELYRWQDRFAADPPAGPEAIAGLLEHWRRAMLSCGALDPGRPKNLMSICQRLFARAGLSQSEVDLLRGVCAAIIRPKRERVGAKKKPGAG